MGCRCLWDASTDKVAEETYINVRITHLLLLSNLKSFACVAPCRTVCSAPPWRLASTCTELESANALNCPRLKWFGNICFIVGEERAGTPLCSELVRSRATCLLLFLCVWVRLRSRVLVNRCLRAFC